MCTTSFGCDNALKQNRVSFLFLFIFFFGMKNEFGKESQSRIKSGFNLSVASVKVVILDKFQNTFLYS